MKSQLAKPFLFLVAFILIVGLACSAASPAPVAEEPPAPAPIEEGAPPPPPPPTDVPAPTAIPEPTVPPTPAPPKFFTEEFDGDLSNWSQFTFGEDENDFDLKIENGRLVFDIQGQGNFIYSYYDAQVYDDVRIETETNNRSYNDNNVSLFCRYTEGRGFYEFSIANSGLYWIFRLDEHGDGYTTLASGGSNKVVTGQHTNQYAASCNGNKLTLYINGVETKTVEDSTYTEGMVGVSVSAFDLVPIIVDFEWFKILEP